MGVSTVAHLSRGSEVAPERGSVQTLQHPVEKVGVLEAFVGFLADDEGGAEDSGGLLLHTPQGSSPQVVLRCKGKNEAATLLTGAGPGRAPPPSVGRQHRIKPLTIKSLPAMEPEDVCSPSAESPRSTSVAVDGPATALQLISRLATWPRGRPTLDFWIP